MITKKIYFTLLTVCIILCVFMLGDNYLVPSNESVEIVDRVETIRARRSSKSYYMQTSSAKYAINEKTFERIDQGDTVTILKSKLTGANQKIRVKVNHGLYTYNLGSAGTPIGVVLLSLLISGITAVLFYYNRFTYAPGRTNLIVFIAFAVIAFLYLHFQ